MGVYKKYRDLSIKYKLLIIFYIQILIPIILIGYMFYQKSENILKSQAVILSQDMLKVLEMRIDDFTKSVEVASRDLLLNHGLYDVLLNAKDDKLEYYNKVIILKDELRRLTLSRGEISSICIVTRDRDFYSFDSNGGSANINELIPYDYLLQLARNRGGLPIWFIDHTSEGQFVYLSRIINDINTFEEIGLMTILVNLEQLQSTYKKLSSDIFKNIVILSENDKVIFSKNNSNLSWIKNINIHKEDKKIGNFYMDKNNDMLISYRKLKAPMWTIVTGFSRNILLKEVDYLKKWAILTFVPAIILLSIFSILTAMDIIHPIDVLVEGMKKLKKGKKHSSIILDRNDELGFLCNNFNEMSEEIEYLVKDIYQEQLTRREAEIKALQAQINPHFLFNTLETINWQAQLKNAPEISKMVTSLSSIMEANIGRDNKLVSLRDEFKYVENYISIMSFRYEEKLRLLKDIDTKLLSFKVPRLLLQPLVENAIYHGIDRLSKEGIIRLNAYQKDKCVLIEIIDNGIGLSEVDLNNINKRLSMGSEDYFKQMKNNNRRSVGLNNVNQRIKLFYGEQYGLNVYSIHGEYTKVVLAIPESSVNEGGKYYVQSNNSR